MLMDRIQILQPLPSPAQQSLLSSLARRSGDLDVLANNSCENDLGSQDTICKFHSCLLFLEMRVEIRNLSNPIQCSPATPGTQVFRAKYRFGDHQLHLNPMLVENVTGTAVNGKILVMFVFQDAMGTHVSFMFMGYNL